MTEQSHDVGSSAEPIDVTIRDDVFVAAFFWLLGAALVVAGVLAPPPRIETDTIGPYGFAIVVGLMIVGCASAVIVRDIYLSKSPERRGRVILGRPDDEPQFPASAVRAVGMMGATVGYAVLLEPLGYIFTSLLFVAGGLRLMNVRSWKLIAGNAVIFTVITYAMFGLLLGVPLPLGPLNDLFVELNIVERVR